MTDRRTNYRLSTTPVGSRHTVAIVPRRVGSAAGKRIYLSDEPSKWTSGMVGVVAELVIVRLCPQSTEFSQIRLQMDLENSLSAALPPVRPGALHCCLPNRFLLELPPRKWKTPRPPCRPCSSGGFPRDLASASS